MPKYGYYRYREYKPRPRHDDFLLVLCMAILKIAFWAAIAALVIGASSYIAFFIALFWIAAFE